MRSLFFIQNIPDLPTPTSPITKILKENTEPDMAVWPANARYHFSLVFPHAKTVEDAQNHDHESGTRKQ